MDFGKLIAGLLQTHECVIVPSLGGFLAQRKSAYRNEDDCLIPPQRVYSFNARLTGNDGLLLHAAVATFGLSYDEASNRLSKFVSAAKSLLAAREKVFVEGVGELSVDEEGNLQFHPAENQSAFNGSFGLRTIRAKPVEKEKEHEVERIPVQQVKANKRTISFRRAKRVKFVHSFARYAALALIFLLVGGVGTVFYFIEKENSSTVNQASLTPAIDTFRDAKTELKREDVQQNAQKVETEEISGEVVKPMFSDAEMVSENSPSGYYVILGAFAKEANADALLNRLHDDLGDEIPLLKKERNGLITVGFFAAQKHKAAVEVLRSAQAKEEKAWLLKI